MQLEHAITRGIQSWDDNVFRHDIDTDTFKIFFVRTTADDVSREEPLNDDGWIKGAFDRAGLLRFIAVEHASRNLPCHLVNDPTLAIDGKVALMVSAYYSEDVDILTIHLVDPEGEAYNPDDSDTNSAGSIIFDLNPQRQLLSIEILDASKAICRARTQR
ncbi:hypothetical protein pkur_cds_288 [Pandoravirus kuranda]|uniref:Uncharacterized protein n=1 Tax=Pandoravirus kuranda TaxID=3019033 RepID=A0AA95EGH7_9VIRU|nr:hypothetical protein pkur_cds_288 [Pandoravirus kuranda]